MDLISAAVTTCPTNQRADDDDDGEDFHGGDLMVLALISTACISGDICSLQAMLIDARTSNAMEAVNRSLWKRVCCVCRH